MYKLFQISAYCASFFSIHNMLLWMVTDESCRPYVISMTVVDGCAVMAIFSVPMAIMGLSKRRRASSLPRNRCSCPVRRYFHPQGHGLLQHLFVWVPRDATSPRV